ncbi:MAG: hypothetical protein VR64_04450 [Desulfatitalea sp. BRH_c12]|nr:MAG: hypothetical protein VR64_04450 [Desulfatitalea sp. BRH_c12]
MKCPKCGYVSHPRDHAFAPPTECPACGVIYSKIDAKIDAKIGTGKSPDMQISQGPLIKKPSPVHEDTLKNARRRVEMRLHQKSGDRLKEKQREQTLALARRLVSEGLRQRQEAWQRRQAAEKAEKAVPESLPTFLEIQTPPLETASVSPNAATTQIDRSPDLQAGASMSDVPEAPSLATLSEISEINQPEPAGMAAESGPTPETDETRSVPMRKAGQAHVHRRRSLNGHASGVYTAVAWLILTAGLVGAVLSWTTISDVQAQSIEAAGGGLNPWPVALLLGFAYLATGVLGFAFFWVASMINNQLADIRHLLLRPVCQKEDTPPPASEC